MFDPIDPSLPASLSFRFDGKTITCAPGHTVASALLAAQVTSLRNTPVSGAPRAPFCMMGACFDCLVEIDGATRQACMTPVADGLEVRRAHQPPRKNSDEIPS